MHDLDLLIDAARLAGRIATSYVGKTARRWDKPGDAGPVTEADLAVNTALTALLQQARPSYGWLSEESEDSAARLARDTVFIIDPIDGTRSFVEGSNTWAHALAIAHQGVVQSAVVYLPLRNQMFAAAQGRGSTLNGRPLRVSDQGILSAADILAARPALDAHHWRDRAPDFRRSYRPSLAYRLATVGQGRFDGMLTLRPSWEWDIAAGALIITEAGGRISTRSGAPLRFNNADPRLDGVVAGNPTIHAALCSELVPSA